VIIFLSPYHIMYCFYDGFSKSLCRFSEVYKLLTKIIVIILLFLMLQAKHHSHPPNFHKNTFCINNFIRITGQKYMVRASLRIGAITELSTTFLVKMGSYVLKRLMKQVLTFVTHLVALLTK